MKLLLILIKAFLAMRSLNGPITLRFFPYLTCPKENFILLYKIETFLYNKTAICSNIFLRKTNISHTYFSSSIALRKASI